MDDTVRMTIWEALDAIGKRAGVTVVRSSTTNIAVLLPNDYMLSLYNGIADIRDMFVEVAVFGPHDVDGDREWIVPDHETWDDGRKCETHVMPFTNAHELVRLADRVSRLHKAGADDSCWCVQCEQALAKEVA